MNNNSNTAAAAAADDDDNFAWDLNGWITYLNGQKLNNDILHTKWHMMYIWKQDVSGNIFFSRSQKEMKYSKLMVWARGNERDSQTEKKERAWKIARSFGHND